jgi:hypothetical protein
MAHEIAADWLINHRSRESFRYAHEIRRHMGALDPVLIWCKSELSPDWRWQMAAMPTDHDPGRYIFYFDHERDYLAFMMRWGWLDQKIKP